MSAKENFRNVWIARFPSDAPPDLPCLGLPSTGSSAPMSGGAAGDRIDRAAVERTLQICNESIALLNLRLQKEEFVASFLWDILHAGVQFNQNSNPSNLIAPPLPTSSGDRPGAPRITRHSARGSATVPKVGKPTAGGRPEMSGLCLTRSMTTDGQTRNVRPPEVEDVDDGGALDGIIPLQDHYNISPMADVTNDGALGSSLPASAQSDSIVLFNTNGLLVKKDSKFFMEKYGEDNENRASSNNTMEVLYANESEIIRGSSSTAVVNEKSHSTPVRMSSFKPNAEDPPSSGKHGPKGRPVPAPRSLRAKPSHEGSDTSGVLEKTSLDRSTESLNALDSQSEKVQGQTRRHASTRDKTMAATEHDADPSFKGSAQKSSRNNYATVHIGGNSAVLLGGDVAVAERLSQNRKGSSDSLGSRKSGSTSDRDSVGGGKDSFAGPLAGKGVLLLDGLDASYSTTEIYEEATPVEREFIEADDASSEDEEPLYFNLLQLKEQTARRAQTLYASRDELKAGLLGQGAGLVGQGAGTQLGQGPGTQLSSLAEVKVKEDVGRGFTGSMKKRADIHLRPAIDVPVGEPKLVLSSDSVRSVGSDNVFDGDNSFGWKNRRSLLRTVHSTDSQSELDDVDTVERVPQCPDDEILSLRKFVVKSILESERSYLGILDILMQYMQTFKNCVGTPQAVISKADIELIFFKIPDLHMAHKMFTKELEPCIENWSTNQQIAEPFKVLADTEYAIAPDYLMNYQKAVAAIQRCRAESEKFALLIKEMKVSKVVEATSLEELLHKPVVRFQRNTLVLHDLIKYTPTSHADYDPLQKILQLAQHFLGNFENKDKDSPMNQRYLAKQGLIVEKVGNVRKLRHIFLFNDVLVCTKPRLSAKQKMGYEAKWYIPLIDLSLDDKACVEEEKQLADCQQAEIEGLQKKVCELQAELKAEMKLSRSGSDAQRNWSFHNRSGKVEKIKKKLIEQQGAMIKASPRLLFRIHNRHAGNTRQYTLLMASDYERSNWRFTIAGLLSRASSCPAVNFSTTDLQNLLNSQKLPKVSTFESVIGIEDLSLEEEHLFGILTITIYKLQGLKHPADAYCEVEVDSFGHFFVKAKTKLVSASTEPTWNQDFEIELEGAQTVRILCYRMTRDVGSLIGTCALELSKAWLRGDFQEKNISLNDENSLTISLRYASRHETLKRNPTGLKGVLFGAKIKTVTRRERTLVPNIVTACIQEVENRGMTEVGIYRVSGASGEIQKLKQAFEKNTTAAVNLAHEADINVVTGLLKLYFRELPEALFTDALYPSLLSGMGLKEPDAKEKYIISILQQLPEPNRSTASALIDHLLKVARSEPENKMTVQNLATVFGPTLLRPAVSDSQVPIEELFSTGTREAMTQTTMLLVFLNLRAKGAIF